MENLATHTPERRLKRTPLSPINQEDSPFTESQRVKRKASDDQDDDQGPAQKIGVKANTPQTAGKKRFFGLGELFSPSSSASSSKLKLMSRSSSVRSFILPSKSAKNPPPRSNSGRQKKSRSTMSSSSLFESLEGDDRLLYQELDEKERLRREAIFELTTSESKFYEDLLSLRSIYYTPMLLLNIITPQQQQALFANLLEVIEAHKDLNDALQPIRESDPSYQRLGSVFNDWFPLMEKVYSVYCANQARAKDTWDMLLRENNPKLQEYLDSARELPQSRKMDLWSLLDAPRRHLQHYVLLLAATLKRTNVEDDDFAELERAIGCGQQAIAFIDRQVTENNKAKVYAIQASLEFPHSWQKIDLVKDNQSLLFEGDAKLKDGKEVHLFLFSEILLITKRKANETKRSVAGRPISLYVAEVSELTEAKDVSAGMNHQQSTSQLSLLADPASASVDTKAVDVECVFRITVPEESHRASLMSRVSSIHRSLSNAKSYTIFCKSSEEKREWVQRIQDAKSQLDPQELALRNGALPRIEPSHPASIQRPSSPIRKRATISRQHGASRICHVDSSTSELTPVLIDPLLQVHKPAQGDAVAHSELTHTRSVLEL